LLATFALGATAASAKEVDWATLNPAFQGATYVKDSGVCYGCHEEAKEAFNHTAHAKVFQFSKAPAAGECESCHGPRSSHVENPGKELALTPAQQDAVCLQCHKGSNRMYWESSLHASGGAACTSCHTVMQKKSDKALLSAGREEAVCYTCHTNVRGEMNKSSHHPVREGKVSCSDCHNPHGTATAGMLKGASVNDTCFNCHQEKRGPFVWVHPPVIEDCLTCHDSHGSNNRKLLTGKDSFLCLQCHTYGGHINLPRYNRTSNPYGEGCVNCHIAVHGSNSPSGAKLTR
jgi:DmsE family decaheme c-type cytochrome